MDLETNNLKITEGLVIEWQCHCHRVRPQILKKNNNKLSLNTSYLKLCTKTQ